MGSPYQWTSDITERCHIMHAKTPYYLSNHHCFHKQCCHFLDQQEMLWFFCLFTSLKTAWSALINEIIHEEGLVQLHSLDSLQGSDILVNGHYPVFPGSSKPLLQICMPIFLLTTIIYSSLLFALTFPHFTSLSISDLDACRTLFFTSIDILYWSAMTLCRTIRLV